MYTNVVHWVNYDILAILLRDMAEQWTIAIRNQLDTFSYEAKDNPDKVWDQVTSADYAAQKAIVDMISKCFPEAWIIAEENNLQKPCTHSTQQLYFTLDPLDGTRAYVRMQSDGIWTMIWVVLDNQIIGAVIADVMTKEVYMLHPSTGHVERYHPLRYMMLEYESRKHFRIAMMDDPRLYDEAIARISHPISWYFDSVSVTNWSIGTNVARVRKNEASAFLFKSWSPMPWDWVPVVGISLALWFTFLSFDISDHTWNRVDRLWSLDNSIILSPTLMIHESEVNDFLVWYWYWLLTNSSCNIVWCYVLQW